MEFRQDGDNMGSGGGGNVLTALMAGSMMNRDRDDGKTTMIAASVYLIVFIIAIIAFAMMFNRDGRNDHRNAGSTTDFAALLTPLIAAKSMESNNCKDSNNFDMLEIKAKLEHNEDRATARETQQLISQQGQSFMQLGFGLSNQIKDSEKDNLKEFGEIKQQLGMQSQALLSLMQAENNKNIINGVIQQLAMGVPRAC